MVSSLPIGKTENSYVSNGDNARPSATWDLHRRRTGTVALLND
jgi:hypothetical protein